MGTVIEVILQTVLAFYGTFFFARIIGKKQIGELTFYDYINGITFGSIAGNMASDLNQRTWQHFIGLFLFALLTFLMQYIALKNRGARKIIEGEATILVHQGKVLEGNMRKTRFNIEDLLSELRKNNIFDIRDAHFAILETDGKLSVLANADKKSITPRDLKLPGQEEGICSELVIDGEVIIPNLKQHGLSKEWLKVKLKENNINTIKEIVLASYNPIDKSIYFDLREDNLGRDTVDISEVEE
ncbi:uncharacterized membrane protein YcaP (DUF421 family) [Orenia metallireducens]|jgi:uncharacterized membrane protein YcaP (DUF421 family)|uniref:Uncharacterized membrane protein YcaP, DUF421 family n=1 Tax=Orenia metallireducens TaxID=1413210 RepID=A0A285F240_9FIRM|nr:DUF421 domain-containing protein [Orenia metallireducens]PRX34724.1 uncharacterized membrane protein YcaP (DUF421 family) [Orenia metallireducens]SNY05355.1 Uncharacterized membrane protein YcaP, DUF421 family [Orenia metallireducens]